jgi:deazaflavin-dependent oxidoreductase (nitroreductase family)
MPSDRTTPARSATTTSATTTSATTASATTTRPRSRFSVPRGLTAGTLAVTGLTWGLYAIQPGASILSAEIQTGLFLGLLLLTICSRRAKVLVARTWQRYVLNPLMRLLLSVGLNPLGLAILETRGRVTGKTRRVPVGNGRKGDSFWIIAEHGTRAGYVNNIQHDPHVRVRLRIGLRYRWVPGIATVCPDDDPLARQRKIIAWHPLRALNAIYVRVFGADLLTVHVQLNLAEAASPGAPLTARSSSGQEPVPDPDAFQPADGLIRAMAGEPA